MSCSFVELDFGGGPDDTELSAAIPPMLGGNAFAAAMAGAAAVPPNATLYFVQLLFNGNASLTVVVVGRRAHAAQCCIQTKS